MRVSLVDWHLDVRYRAKAFSGWVAIHFDEAAGRLMVDAARLEILSATLDGRPIEFHEDREKGELSFEGISPDPHRLEIDYRGQADPDGLVGFYVAPAGSQYVLTTQFFPTGSRRVIPGFEHPSVKTVYRLTLTVDRDVTAVFNTGPESVVEDGERRTITFAPTPPMSAYLLYLGVGPFDTLKVPGHPWSVTVATSPGRAPAGRYAAERAVELITAYEEYYGVPYPLPKLDLVALEKFAAGAMENWGAITFQESMLLVDPTTTVRERRLGLSVLAHEVAHQWFGNLVTPAAWDDFWLNESFATFAGHSVIDRKYPSDQPWNYFMYRYYNMALDEDGGRASRPVRTPVATPEELNEITDEITYGKGAAVLRMIESYLGAPVFRDGLARYLARHRFANARADDLWRSLDEASNLPVSRVMAEWIGRAGYPMLEATWSNGRLTLRQERFWSDGQHTSETWPIPLRIVSARGEERRLIEESSVELPMPTSRGLRVNSERTAFLRVQYDDRLFEELLQDFLALSPIDQCSLAVDTLAFAYAGRSSVDRFLRLVRAAEAVAEELPVCNIVAALHDLRIPLFDDPRFSEANRRFLRAQLDRVGVDRRPGESESAQIVRESVTDALARSDAPFAREMAARFPDIDRAVPELRPAIALGFAAAQGADAFDPLVERLRASASEGERLLNLGALSGFDDPTLLRRALDLVPSPGVPTSAAIYLVVGMTLNPRSGAPFFEWYRDRSADMAKWWAGTPLLGTVLSLGLPAVPGELESTVDQYFREHPPADTRVGLAWGLETMHLRARLRRQWMRSGPG